MDSLLFYEPYTERYFNSSLAAFNYALLMINKKLALEGNAQLGDFFELLGIPISERDDEMLVGWYDRSCPWIEIEHKRATTDDGLEVYILEYITPVHIDSNVPRFSEEQCNPNPLEN